MFLQYIALITVQYYLFQTTAIDTSHNCKFSQNLNESQRWTRDGDNLTHYLRHFISCYKVYNCTSNLLLIIGKAPLVTATLQQNNNYSYILTLTWDNLENRLKQLFCSYLNVHEKNGIWKEMCETLWGSLEILL